MLNNQLSILVVAATVGLASTFTLETNQAQAVSFTPKAAVNDSYAKDYGDGHAFWFGNSQNNQNRMPGGNRYIFKDGTGIFKTFDDGTANLVGTIFSTKAKNKKWEIDLDFVLTTASAKKELINSAYAPVGSIDTNPWSYYQLKDSSTLIGAGQFRGLQLELTPRGGSEFAFQLGQGANGKNVNYGFSGWFNWKITGDSNAKKPKFIGRSGKGDINIDTQSVPEPIPEPSTLLGSAAVLGLGGLLKKQRSRMQNKAKQQA